MGSKLTKEQFETKIKLSFPEWNYEILEYNSCRKPLKIKCDNCGKVMTFTQACRMFNRVNICECYKKFSNYLDKIKWLGTQLQFSVIGNDKNIRSSKIATVCLKCGTKQIRTSANIMLAPNHCPGCSNHKDSFLPISFEEAQKRINDNLDGYILLEYEGISKPALVKHKCGFVFKTTKLSEMINGHNSGCPKCKSSKSKGEKAVEEYLLSHNIKYIAQKSFLPQGKQYRYRFDFYLTDYDIAIEYQGEQHFCDNGFAREGLDKIKERDEDKRKYCHDNNIILIEISYKDLKKIPKILFSRFNDYGISQ